MRGCLFFLCAVAALGAGPAGAADCGGSWPGRRDEMGALLAAPVVADAFVSAVTLPPVPPGAVENEAGVRLPLVGGGSAILAHEWTHCRRGDADCEPDHRYEIQDYLPEMGAYLVAGWEPGRQGAIMRLVDDRTGAVTLIGGRPHPSPSRGRAVVVAGDSAYAWAGVELWRLDRPVPRQDWDQEALASADYAFVRWQDDDTVVLAARRVVIGQPEPLAVVLTCAAGNWHLIHNVAAPWLAAERSPSGHRHALVRTSGVVIWQDGEQVFAAATDVAGFAGWRDEDNAVFFKPSSEPLTVHRGPDGWAVVE